MSTACCAEKLFSPLNRETRHFIFLYPYERSSLFLSLLSSSLSLSLRHPVLCLAAQRQRVWRHKGMHHKRLCCLPCVCVNIGEGEEDFLIRACTTASPHSAESTHTDTFHYKSRAFGLLRWGRGPRRRINWSITSTSARRRQHKWWNRRSSRWPKQKHTSEKGKKRDCLLI